MLRTYRDQFSSRHIADVVCDQCCGHHAPLISSGEYSTGAVYETEDAIESGQIFKSRASTSARLDSLVSVLAPTAPQELRPSSIISTTISPSWVAFTATARAYRPQLSHTLEHHQHGSRLPPNRSWIKYASLQRRAQHLRRSVWSLETPTVLLRSRSLLVRPLCTVLLVGGLVS